MTLVPGSRVSAVRGVYGLFGIAVPPGTTGTVEQFRDFGTIVVRFDNGRRLGVCDTFLAPQAAGRPTGARVLTPAPSGRPHDSVGHESLALADSGACIVRLANEDDGSTVYQCRRSGRVVAEAPTLGVLAEMLDRLDNPANRG